MARKSPESRLLDLIERDPRAAALPPAAAMLWIRLARLMAQFGEPAAFHWSVTLRSVSDLAVWFRVSVTETETQIRNLLETGALLELADGFALPDWTGIDSQKARSARENGRKGGRPRRDGAPAQLSLPPMAIPGGRSGAPPGAVPAETQETHGVDATSSSLKEVDSLEVEEEVAERGAIVRELGALCRMSGSQIRRSSECVDRWLARGATRALLRDVVERIVTRPNAKSITSFAYFEPAVTEALRQAPIEPIAESVASLPDALVLARRQWAAELERWNADGRKGPSPKRPESDDFQPGEVAA
jgi:hypothetical protein